MNIETTSSNIFETLESSKIEQFRIGSYLFGLENNNSDDDYLVLYNIFQNELQTFLTTSHNYQYKLDGEDRNYVNVRNFVRNLLNGEQTYFFELIHDETQMRDSSLEYLYDNREKFINYSTIKAYIGLAKRDIKFAQKETKRLVHAYRGIVTAENLIHGGSYSNEFSERHLKTMIDIKDEVLDTKSIRDMVSDLKVRQEVLRKQINQKLDKNEINRFMDSKDLKDLDEWVNSHINWYNNSRNSFIDLTRFYEIEENPNEIY